ncbi:exocyst complex component 8 isoform X2 [Nilaparvata lugens]|uniref:exocyst complex component 8 isoform X2 n=1 Tax=Nilaparvata lugens TaxID=108931 RepID=UPI00193DEB54|nr:exocyst complex component 8 isoform X2 [Nilaparvata lugens]
MAEVSIKKFSAVDFSPDKYVKEISQVCIGGQDLQQHRTKVLGLSEETSAALKKNVYQNYMQFIETAKEISHLESEMYQLSHLLTEQRSLLAALSQTPAAALENNTKDDNESTKKEDKREKLLAAIAEKVEGCVSLLDVPNRGLLYEGDLLELDPLENTPLHRVHAYLLTDILLISTWISNRRGPARYKFQTQYELGSLAVVNVRDLGSIRHAFKLLAFPDSRVFQCTNNQSKREWLDQFETAKKARLAVDQQKRETVPTASEQRSPMRTESIDSCTNPFGDPDSDHDYDSMEETPEWLLEVPDDLDVLIVERHYEDAHALIQRSKQYLEKAPQNPANLDLKKKLDLRINSLISVLTSELSVSPDKSLQGGLRASRRAMRLLNLLGKTTQACDLFLKLCSSILKTQMKRVKREGAAVVYVKRLSRIFFSNLSEMIREFQIRTFSNCPEIASVFTVWVSQELIHFTSHLIKQIFVPQSGLSTLAECVTLVREQCEQLNDLGIDVCFQLEGQLSSPITRALVETRDKLVDAVKLRAAEDSWHPLNVVSRQALLRMNAEFTSHGLMDLHQFQTGEWWLELTSNTVAFTKLFISVLKDGLLLVSTDSMHSLDKVIYDVFSAQLKHVLASLRSEKLVNQRPLIVKNGKFLMDCLRVACSHMTLHNNCRLKELHKQFSDAFSSSFGPSSTTKIVTDYI